MANMNKIWLVIKREYKTRVLKKSFILLTLLTPLLIALMSFLPALIMEFGGSTTKEVIAIIDRTGQYIDLFESNEQYTFVHANETLSSYREAGEDQEVTAVLEIRQNLLEDPQAVSLFSFKTLPPSVENYINTRLSDYISEQKINSYNIPELREIIRSSKINISIATYRWSDAGAETASSGTLASSIGFILNMVIYMFITIYGMMVLQGVMEEKKSRIMEVMVSCVRPFELMIGKIIGIGLVGLTQFCIWIVLTIGILVSAQFFFFNGMYSAESAELLEQSGRISSENAHMLAGLFAELQSINYLEIIMLFIGFFIGGYLLYASILAGFGSAISSDEDSAQITAPITILMLLSFYIGMASTQNPEGTLALWTSFIPFTSPVVMMVRLPYGVPVWQQLLSLSILYLSAIGITYLSARIYRVGVLMYGKKPNLKEMWKWLRYK